MFEKSSNGIMLFAKYPSPGNVKSRLAADIGCEAAAELYRRFVVDTVKAAGGVDAARFICFAPDDAAGLFHEWLGDTLIYIPQGGGDLGQRLHRAFQEGFAMGLGRLLVIGTDSPDIAPALLNEAFELLQDHDAVIGPAGDGGYYLLGFTSETYCPEVFTGITWSTDRVYGETLRALSSAGRSVFRLPVWQDVDILEDLVDLVQRSETGAFASSDTMAYIREVILPTL